MTKAVPAALVLTLACLFPLSSALPSLLTQIMSAQTVPNAPRTLLGKPYRRRRDSQDCPPSCWTLAVADRNNSDANADADPEVFTLTGSDHASARQALASNSGWSQTKMNTEPRVPLPLVLNAMNFAGSVPARLRLMRLKRPLRYGPCLDDAPLFSQARSDGMTPRDEDKQHAQPPVASRPEGKIGSRDVSVPVRRLKRLYDKGEWKSRLFEEY